MADTQVDESKTSEVDKASKLLPTEKPTQDSKVRSDEELSESVASKSLTANSSLISSGQSIKLSKTFTLNPSKLNLASGLSVDDLKCEKNNLLLDEEQTNKSVISNKSFTLLHLKNDSQESGNDTSVKIAKICTPEASVRKTEDFVFGQNIIDRVVTPSKVTDSSNSFSKVNGNADMLFSCTLKQSNNIVDSNSTVEKKDSKTLSESAREYEEARAVKRKYEEVEIKTGEEEETNILQITCKLFAYDKSTGGSWQERGRGTLRLNDYENDNNIQSRLVFRTNGSLRVVLNTKIWPDMSVQLANEKSIRLTAFNNGDVRVFLVMGTQEDIKQLYKQLDVRVKREKISYKNFETSKLKSCKKLLSDSGGD